MVRAAAVQHPARRVLARVVRATVILLLLAGVAFFPFAGRYLVYEDSLQKADVIVVLAGARVERWLEAVELYRGGWAAQIAISPGRLESAEIQLHSMGIRFPSEAELARDAMVQLKIPVSAIETLPGVLDNTADEAAATHELAIARHWSRLLVITSKYHTRRALFAFRREFAGSNIEILMRASRYDTSTPERWWTKRADLRYVPSELQKLLAYRLGLGK